MPTACHHLPCGSHPAGVAPRALSSEIIARVGVALDGSASERDARTAHHTTQRQQPHHHCPSPPHPPPLPWATVQRKAEAVAGAGCVRVMQGALERKRSEKSSARGDATRPNRCLLPSPSSLHRPSPHERTNERTPRYDCSAERRAKAPQIREPPLRVDGGPERSRPVRSRRSANIMHRKGREKGANGFYGFCTHMSGSG